jgi:glycosyltransferase involved in cell wall biosynthesis
MTTEKILARGTEPPNSSDARPFWSVMIPVYNSTKYLARTLKSVLDQDPGPAGMQIEVVDGYSTIDIPEPLVQQLTGGRVSTFRHAQPLSMAANWNSCIERARGEWVHILHSDDFVLPGFYSRLEESLKGRNDVGAAFTRWTTVDASDQILQPAAPQMETAGILPDRLDRLGAAQVIQFPAMVVRKSAYQAVGGFRSDLSYALDWEMWVRLAVRYPIWYEPELLACYRAHTESETMRQRRLGEDLADQVKAVPIIESYLPPASKARAGLALLLLEVAKGQFLLRLPREGMRRIVSALRLSRSPRVIASALRVCGWALAGAIRVGLRRLGLLPFEPNRQG